MHAKRPSRWEGSSVKIARADTIHICRGGPQKFIVSIGDHRQGNTLILIYRARGQIRTR